MAYNGNKEGALDFEAPITELEKKIEELRQFSAAQEVDLSGQIEKLIEKCNEKKRIIFSKLTPWQKVQLARHPLRPLTTDYINYIVQDFIELSGDRDFREDKAIITGIGWIGGQRFIIVGHRKGKSTKEKLSCNFGCAHPEGYKKALVRMRLAEKFHLPIASFINTPGAYPGVGAEERGQAFIIARNLMEMARLRVPIIGVVIGEGGSGGALGIGVCDRILMLEHAYYSVISPEGCAAILWRSAEFAPRAAETLRLTAQDLLSFGIIDEILPEPLGGAHRDPARMAGTVMEAILRHLNEIHRVPVDDLVQDRFAKFKRMGVYQEGVAGPVAGRS